MIRKEKIVAEEVLDVMMIETNPSLQMCDSIVRGFASGASHTLKWILEKEGSPPSIYLKKWISQIMEGEADASDSE